jgi:hypothetical protein
MEVDTAQLVALASALIHAEEYMASGHSFDLTAMNACRDQAAPLLKELDSLALIPVKRFEAPR